MGEHPLAGLHPPLSHLDFPLVLRLLGSISLMGVATTMPLLYSNRFVRMTSIVTLR